MKVFSLGGSILAQHPEKLPEPSSDTKDSTFKV